MPRLSAAFRLTMILMFCAVLMTTPGADGAKKTSSSTPKPWLEMDRGPCLTTSIESSLPERGMTPKGLMIRVSPVGAASPAYVLFDEDLLRYSVGWTGGSIDFKGVSFDGTHRVWPTVVGEQIFGNRMMPGWAKSGSFDDPRTKYPSTDYSPKPQSWQNRGYGPLPHDQARYKGLYLNGDRVIVSYTVAGTPVLESPGWGQVGPAGAFTRTLNIERSAEDMVLQILEHPAKGGGIVPVASVATATPSNKGSAKGMLAVLGNGDVTSPAAADRPAAVEDGLVAGWSFDELDEKEFAATSKKYVAEITGGKQVPGRFGMAVEFKPGQYAAVAGSDEMDFGRDFSLVAWVKGCHGGTIFSRTSAGKWAGGGKTLYLDDQGTLTFEVGDAGAVKSTKAKITDDQWHAVAMTYDAKSGAATCYVDGAVTGNGTIKSVPDPTKSQIRFGFTSEDFPKAPSNASNDTLDEIHLYRRALDAKEIAGMSKAGERVLHPVAVAAVGASEQMTWELTEQQQLRLHIPAAATPAKLKILIGPVSVSDRPAFADAVSRSAVAEDLSQLTHGGPPRWPEKVTTDVKLGADADAYTVDTLTAPTANPWKAPMRFGGFDFFKDGKRAAICTWDGDVFIVDGLGTGATPAPAAKLTWQRIATGMFQPLGVKIVPDDQGREQIYVCCRDQITRLHDLNGDGEIDFYETFNNDHQVTEHFHEFAMGLQTDAEGNFYYAKSARHALDAVVPQHGTLIKVSKDGSKTEILCNGFRAANGFGLGPNGEMAATDQEGYWTPANRINLVKPGGFYGNLWSYLSTPRSASEGYDPPLCWLPVKLDRSPAEDLWVTSDKWGPLKGKMIHTSYGVGKLFLIPYEFVDGVPQGGALPFPGINFPTGVMRARFNPADGQLYACGLVGWSSNCAEPGGFYRVRYTGKKVYMPAGLEVKKEGVLLTFTEPLDKEAAQDADNYAVRQWQYRWTENYGSPQYSVANPSKQALDDVDVAAAKLSADGKSVLLQIPKLKPVMQMQIEMNIKAADGTPVKMVVHNTINKVPR